MQSHDAGSCFTERQNFPAKTYVWLRQKETLCRFSLHDDKKRDKLVVFSATVREKGGRKLGGGDMEAEKGTLKTDELLLLKP